MSEKRPFDRVKAGFYLVAAVIAAQIGLAAMALVFCFLKIDDFIAATEKCDANNRIGELLATVLAAAIAFAAGLMRNGGGGSTEHKDEPREPPET